MNKETLAREMSSKTINGDLIGDAFANTYAEMVQEEVADYSYKEGSGLQSMIENHLDSDFLSSDEKIELKKWFHDLIDGGDIELLKIPDAYWKLKHSEYEPQYMEWISKTLAKLKITPDEVVKVNHKVEPDGRIVECKHGCEDNENMAEKVKSQNRQLKKIAGDFDIFNIYGFPLDISVRTSFVVECPRCSAVQNLIFEKGDRSVEWDCIVCDFEFIVRRG